MMKEMIKKSLGFWNNYWGSSIFPYLLVIALLYLLIFKHKKNDPVCTGICFSDAFSVLFSIYGKNHTEMYRRECLLESFVARTINIGDRTGIDRVYPWKEKLPAAGSSGSFCRNDRLGRQRVLYRGLLS